MNDSANNFELNENIDNQVDQDTDPRPDNKLLKISAVAVVVFLVLIVLAIWMVYGNMSTRVKTEVEQPTQAVVPQQELKQQDINLRVDLVMNDEGAYELQLYALPVQPIIELTTFSILMRIATDGGETLSAVANLDTGEALLNNGWSFPFARTEAQEDGLVFKMAGLFISREPYSLSQETMLATVPLDITENTTQISLELDMEDSKFFDKRATEYEFTLLSPIVYR